MKTDAQPKQKKNKKTSSNYIDNEKLYQEMLNYVNEIKQYNKQLKKLKPDEPKPVKPRVSEYVGKSIIMIANRLATKPNFANYVHREEMIGDGIENCLMYIDNFDPNKSKNPFAYFTQIIYYAFVRRIQKEKKQMYVKMKVLENLDQKGSVSRTISEKMSTENKNVYAEIFHLKDSDINLFEKKNKNGNSKKNKKPNLEDFFE